MRRHIDHSSFAGPIAAEFLLAAIQSIRRWAKHAASEDDAWRIRVHEQPGSFTLIRVPRRGEKTPLARLRIDKWLLDAGSMG